MSLNFKKLIEIAHDRDLNTHEYGKTVRNSKGEDIVVTAPVLLDPETGVVIDSTYFKISDSPDGFITRYQAPDFIIGKEDSEFQESDITRITETSEWLALKGEIQEITGFSSSDVTKFLDQLDESDGFYDGRINIISLETVNDYDYIDVPYIPHIEA